MPSRPVHASMLMSLLLLFLVVTPLLSQQSGDSHVELILDASGSMYNKLDDGRYRITAAKDTLRDFVESLPSDEVERRTPHLRLRA